MKWPPLLWWDLPNDCILYSAYKESCEQKAGHGEANSLVLIEKLERKQILDLDSNMCNSVNCKIDNIQHGYWRLKKIYVKIM